MEHWRKNRLLFSVLMVPPTFWLAIFFTLPLALVWVYSFGERGPQGQTILAFSLGNFRSGSYMNNIVGVEGKR